jgi:hypothetical protein
LPSSYSQTLRIELIGAGEQDGTWGTTTNSNLGTLIEQAITGVETITMIDADYTLTAYNGLTDESRNAVLVVGGTNTAVRDVIAPAVEKIYVIRNNTSGGFGVRIKTSSGTGITIPTSATQIVYCNGTDFFLAASQTNVLAGTGVSVSTAGIDSTVSNTGVLSVAGTASQITASASTGAITLSLPATINVNTSGNAATATTAGYITNSAYNGYGTRTVSTSAPSGGSDGDIWYQVA